MKGKAIVIKEFRDAHDFAKVHKVGDDVTKFEKARKERLVNLGYVKIEGGEAPNLNPNPNGKGSGKGSGKGEAPNLNPNPNPNPAGAADETRNGGGANDGSGDGNGNGDGSDVKSDPE